MPHRVAPSRLTSTKRRASARTGAGLSLAIIALAVASPAKADQGGVSFWVPGFFGSLAAAPAQPGTAVAFIGYHTSVDAGADVAFARQVYAGRITVPFNGRLSANLNADATLGMVAPSYTFATPIFGAQAQIALLVPFGRSGADVDATLTGVIGPIGFTRSVGRSDAITGFGDVLPQFNLRWNMGVHNIMTYVTGNIQVGRYDPNRLANLGLGHQALDGGVGYTYFNPHTGWEFSSVLGFTYNFENKDLQYKNGVDGHLDWALSRFISPQVQIGLVGYLYQQLGCDSGAGDRVGCFRSRVAGVGPQVGFIIPMSNGLQGYLNFKGYGEFAAEHRPEGWNAWVTFAISPAPKRP
jgi:hypothetical protein